jgi:hypothetical protein
MKPALRLASYLLSHRLSHREGADPAGRRGRAAAQLVHAGLAFCVVASAALLLGVLAIETNAHWVQWTKVGVGVAMLAEGALLATNWRGARHVTIWRLQRKRTPTEAFRSRLGWRLASPALQLLGLVWLGAGTLTAALGLQQLV